MATARHMLWGGNADLLNGAGFDRRRIGLPEVCGRGVFGKGYVRVQNNELYQ